MPKLGAVRLVLTDADGTPFRGEARVRIDNDNDRPVFDQRAEYRAPVQFRGLMTQPRGRHLFHIKTRRRVPVTFFVTVEQDDHERRVRLLHSPRVSDANGNKIAFPAFGDLSAAGIEELERLPDDLDETIVASDSFPVRQVPWRAFYDTLVARKAEGANHRRLACLLNLVAKLRATPLDTLPGSPPATTLLGGVIRIEQDRLYAQVNPSFELQPLLDELDDRASKIFEPEDSRHHNVPTPPAFEKHRHTYKSTLRDKVANLQLSFASRTASDGRRVWVLDADIDENTGLAHVIEEGLVHFLTRTKTNPYMVHQLLCASGITPLYRLVTDGLD